MDYTMKDLGYPRTPTSAMMRITSYDGRAWEFPAQIVADSRDGHYADEKEDTIGFIRNGSLSDDYELRDWAMNNMDWSDVAEYARQVDDAEPLDMEDVWRSASPKVVGKV